MDTNSIEMDIQRRLFALQDLAYKDFTGKLIPTVHPDRIIGVRIPQLRQLARTFAGTSLARSFLAVLPHQYHEENNLHGCLLERVKDYHAAVQAINLFLPHIDNWATCDLMAPKVMQEHLPELYEQIKDWLASGRIYTVRFAIGMLLRHFLDDAFRPEMLDLVAVIGSEAYYVQMMIAWYFATALAKQPASTLPFIQEQRLDPWTHNKTIQKAIESRRISDSEKAYLRTLKIR